MKFLFIDDNSHLLASLERALGGIPAVEFAECRSLDEAKNAIRQHRPNVVFLDHRLTPEGEEGLEVVDWVRDGRSGIPSIKFYSTTSLTTVVGEYEKRRIENLSPLDLQELKRIIDNHVFAEQARMLIDRVGPTIGRSIGNFTDEPTLLEVCPGICAVRRQAENGYSEGYDTIYLVWRDKDGKLNYRRLGRSANHEYMQIRDIRMSGAKNENIVVEVSGGKLHRVPIAELNL